MKIIILEGISGAGKSAVLHPVLEMSNYRDWVIMRGPASMWVYNKVYDRDVYDYESIIQTLVRDHELHVVWLRVRPDEALRRKTAKGDLDRIEDLESAATWFGEYFYRITALATSHEVATDDRSLQDVVDEIRMKIYGD